MGDGTLTRHVAVLQVFGVDRAFEIRGPERDTRERAEEDIPILYARAIEEFPQVWLARQSVNESLGTIRFNGFTD